MDGTATTPPSRRVGRYLLFEAIGAGGMGEVHRARVFAAEGVVKDLCIKRIRAERLSRLGTTERFIAEARLSVRLTHGNIVPVFDFGRAGDEYYLAMEWVDGADLRALILGAEAMDWPFAPEVCAHIGAEIARALAYAHELGAAGGESIVHGDVKPENVLVSRAGDVKLTDFGVATLAGDAGVGGTPAYMPPEQRAGDAIDPRSDLYALGVMLVELYTLERPSSDGGWIDRVPAEIAPILESLLADDPDRRPPDARRVAQTLEEVVSRARAAGGIAPRDELASRAAAAALRRRTRSEALEIGPDASFLRDGLGAGFVARMTGTTAITAAETRTEESSTGAPHGVDAGARVRSGGRGLPMRAVVLSLVVVGLVAAVVSVAAPRTEHRPSTPVTAPAGRQPTPSARDRATAAQRPASARGGIPSRPPPAAAHAERRGRPAAPAASTAPAASPPASPATRLAPSERPVSVHAAARPSARGATSPPRSAGSRDNKAAPADERGRRVPAVDGPAEGASGAGARASAGAPADAAMATLNVNAIPWADVHIDGHAVGVTPLFGLHLPAGRHVIQLSNAPLSTQRETEVHLVAGQQRDVVVDLR